MSPQRARKLKDTCDLCSASKIKCERQWPQCSRCEKLGQQCFYSPARRQGRPYPSRKNARKTSTGSVQRPSHQQQKATKSNSTSSQSVSPDVIKRIPDSGAKSVIKHQQQHKPRPCTTGYQPNLLLEYPGDGSACQNQRSSISHNNLEWSNPSISTASPDILPSHPSFSTRSSVTDVDDHGNTHSANPSNSDFNRNAESSDCTLLATEVLQILATATTQSLPQQTPISSSSFSNPKVNRPNFDTQLEVASTAIKRLFSILICPCSENPHVGLLCIAVCTAILDVFWGILQSCIRSTIPSSASGMDDTTTNGRCNSINEPTSSISIIQDMISTFNHQQSHGESQGRRFNQQVVVRRILEELPKAANVVMQLTQRYKTTTSPHNGHDEVAFLLPTLAIAQRGRLKAIVQKATGLLGNI